MFTRIIKSEIQYEISPLLKKGFVERYFSDTMGVCSMRKTVFISSTYEDLKEHRAKTWDILNNFDVNIRGMEEFGTRKETPLQTCLSEVEQSDIYIGIIAMRLGSIEPSTEKSYTQLEYEKAPELKKDILIYIFDKNNGSIKTNFIDFGEKHEKLLAFKSILKERHTIDTFGQTMGIKVGIIQPELDEGFAEFLFVDYKLADNFLEVRNYESIEIYAKLLFSDKSVSSLEANFVQKTYYSTPGSMFTKIYADELIKRAVVEAEGEMVILLTKIL